MNSLLSHWNRAPLKGSPYVHPDDKAALSRASPVQSYESFVAEMEHGAVDLTALHLSLMPVPYLGDLDNADVLILLLNPGLHPSDYLLEEKFPEFRDHLFSVIRQESKVHPFLDPRWAWTSGFTWWQRKLGEVAQVIAKEHFQGHYGQALRSLASRIAVIELMPYHSMTFGGLTNLPSTNAALEFVRGVAAAGDRTIVVTRKSRQWDLPTASNVVTYTGGQARGASLSPRSDGGRAILKAYGIALAEYPR